jgi:hypothetical protein
LNGGRLHPFYDGCGRISRSFGASLLLRASELLPLFEDTHKYFAMGNDRMFETYYQTRIKACAIWLGKEVCPTGRHGQIEDGEQL